MFNKQNLKKLAPIAVAAVLGGTSFAAYQHLNKTNALTQWTETTPVVKTNLGGTTPATGNTAMIPADFSVASEKATAAVVHIKSTLKPDRSVSQMEIPEEFRDFFGGRMPQQGPQGRAPKAQASGSGVIINPDGYIVTNNHVIQGAESLEVTLADKRTFKAKVIGSDPNTDIALIQIDTKNLPFLTFANSDVVKVGQWVLAVGNPYNLTSTVTAGIVSAKGRSINILGENAKAPIESFIQTDAAVNPGNSGGALVDLNGNLIGINTAIASQSGAFVGYSFAVPSSIAHKVVEDLSKYGTVQRGYLGVGISEIDGAKANTLHLNINKGVRVENFAEQSAARDAGVKVGDVITKIDGQAVSTVPQLQEIIAQHKPNDQVAIVVYRDGTEKSIDVTLKNNAGSTRLESASQAPVLEQLGLGLRDLTPKQKKDWGINQGVQVGQLSAGLIRENTDMQEGFVITKIDKTPVASAADAIRLLENKKGGVLIEGFDPESGETKYYAIGL